MEVTQEEIDAVENLLQAAEHGGGWLEFARIAMMQALYPKTRS